MCWCGFIDCNNCTPGGGAVKGAVRVEMGTGRIWNISVLSAQVFCEPKTDLKSKVYKYRYR